MSIALSSPRKLGRPAGGLLCVLGLLAASVAHAQLPPVGSFAQLVSGGGWATTITLHNNGTSTAQVHLDFYGDDGAPLFLPFTFPQGGSARSGTSLDTTMGAGEQWVVRTAGSGFMAGTSAGWVQVRSDGSVAGFAVFSLTSGANLNEAVVPLETRNPANFTVPFDNTAGYTTGVAIANVSGQATSIPLTIRDDKGFKIASDSIALPAHGHTAVVVPTGYPGAANRRGNLQFDTPSGGQINVLGLSFNPTLNFSSLPPEGAGAAPGAAAPGATAAGGPVISGVTAILPQQTQTITITGSGFGTQAAYNGDSTFIEITDTTRNWNAGLSNSTGSETVTLNVTSWTDTKIVVAGFTGAYGPSTYSISNGDAMKVKVWNAQTQTGPASFSLTAGAAVTPTISTASLPNGVVGTAYSQTLSGAGGTGGFVWTVASGALPGGLSLSQAGVVSGTPSAAGSFSFVAQISDTAGNIATKALGVTIVSAQPPTTQSCFGIRVGSYSKLSVTTIEPGMTTTLSWSTSCPTVTITPGFGQVASSGSVDLRPTQTTQYVLVYKSSDGSTQQETQTVTVVPVATINSFTASSPTVASGSPVTLSWNTSNAHYLALEPYGACVGGIPRITNYGSGSVQVTPTVTTTYTLTVVDLVYDSGNANPGCPIPLGNTVTKTVTVTVSGTAGPAGNDPTFLNGTWTQSGDAAPSYSYGGGSCNFFSSGILTFVISGVKATSTTFSGSASVTGIQIRNTTTCAITNNYNSTSGTVSGSLTINGDGSLNLTGRADFSLPEGLSQTFNFTGKATPIPLQSQSGVQSAGKIVGAIVATFTAAGTEKGSFNIVQYAR